VNREPASARARAPWRGRLRDWVGGGVLFGGLLLVVHYTVGWADLLAPWRELSPALLALLVLLAVSSHLLRALRFYDCFHPLLQGRFPTLLRLTVFHNTANNLLPMRAGELVFPWLMRRYFGHGLIDATARLLWVRLLDLHLLGLVGIWMLYLGHPSWAWLGVALGWVAALALVTALARAHASPLAEGRGGRVRRVMAQVLAAVPACNALLARLYLWTGLIWGLKLAAFAILLRHFVPADSWRVLAGVIAAELSSVLPVHGIAGTGTYEAAAVAALVPLGIDPTVALAGAVNLHLFLLGVTLLLAACAPLLPIRRD